MHDSQDTTDYSIIFDELDRTKVEDDNITTEVAVDNSRELDSISELREIVAQCRDSVLPLFTTT